MSLYIAASCQCVEFSKHKGLRWVCNNIFGNCCSIIVFMVVFLWAIGMGASFFIALVNDLEGCASHKLDNVLFVFFVSLIWSLYQTYFIFYTFVDVLIFYPNWKKQTGQKNLSLFDYKNLCCDGYKMIVNSWQNRHNSDTNEKQEQAEEEHKRI